MAKHKTILNRVSDMYMSAHPHFFYREVVYFPIEDDPLPQGTFIYFNDILVDQIDVRLVEQDVESELAHSSACFFFKS